MDFNPDPRGLLVHCHPDLKRMALAAAVDMQGWKIDYGIRTIQAEAQAVATGHSMTMHSRHLPDAHFGGVAMAFDFFVVGPGGQPDWRTPGNYPSIGQAIVDAGARLGIRAQSGAQAFGAWTDGVVSTWRDYGHIQLDPSAYA